MRSCFSKFRLKLVVIPLLLVVLILLISGIYKANLNIKLDNTVTNDVKNTIQNLNIIDSSIWQIEIPKINLKANIAEGTTNEILNEFVGHFEETQKSTGNVGLAAHNRGYKVNYFERLKELEVGDEIIYFFNGVKRTYTVDLKSIIKDTEWKNLENTEENKITLITCVENEPEYRRCIQATEINN